MCVSAVSTRRAWAAFVAQQLADLSKAGLTGVGVSLVNYAQELPFFCAEVLPRLVRMGVRDGQAAQ